MKYKEGEVYRYKYINSNYITNGILDVIYNSLAYTLSWEFRKLNLYKKSEIRKEDNSEYFIDINSLDSKLLKILLGENEISK